VDGCALGRMDGFPLGCALGRTDGCADGCEDG
jgi:hypothetical protein